MSSGSQPACRLVDAGNTLRCARSRQAGANAGLRGDDVGFAEADPLKFDVIPAKAGIHASFGARDVAGSRQSRGHERKHVQGRRLFAVALAIAAALIAPNGATAQLKPNTAGVETQEIEVRAHPIASFARGDATPKLSPRLEWRGGLTLTSPSSHFGGWSGLILDTDGKGLIVVSDSGIWMTGTLAYDGARPKALRDVRIGALRNKKGGPLAKLRERDAEAITLASGTPQKGTAYIAFEQADRIGVFPVDNAGIGTPRSYLTMPQEAARMRLDGIEALAVLSGGPHKGALVAFAENPLRGEKEHRGWVWIGGKPHGFTVPDIGGYSITDAASLADGCVLLVERRFRWTEGLKVRLRRLDADGIKPGGRAKGEILLDTDHATAEIDNLEALAVSEDEHGETVITLMSDDNFNRILQRTVLLQFTLKDKAVAETAGTVPDAQSTATKP